MKWTVLIASSAMALATIDAGAASSGKNDIEKSPDVLRPQQLRKSANRIAQPAALSATGVVTAAALTVEDVGDPDSFGSNVTYLGLAQTLPISIITDCTGSDPTLETCIVAQPAPLVTSFNVPNNVTLTLPAKASKTLLCFALTPFVFVGWSNNTGAQQIARFNAVADISIDNSVLNDPTLIDPNTGMPFGGSLSLSLSTWSNSHSIGNGEFENERSQQSRSCIAGVISKRQLVETYGLTDTQASQFFKKTMTLHFGSHGSVSMSDSTSYFYGIRLYGDQ